MIIGITGGTGSGKTSLLNLIHSQGGKVLDCDLIYHDLLKADKALLCSIAERFPGTVHAGVLDRKALGAIVFADPEALQDLNRITHQAVYKKVLSLLEKPAALTAIDAIGLFEGGLAKLCDVTVAVTAPEEVRISRLMTRDHISEEYARLRISAQKSQEVFSKQCDYVLENNGTQVDFQNKCLAFLHQLGIIKERT